LLGLLALLVCWVSFGFSSVIASRAFRLSQCQDFFAFSYAVSCDAETQIRLHEVPLRKAESRAWAQRVCVRVHSASAARYKVHAQRGCGSAGTVGVRGAQCGCSRGAGRTALAQPGCGSHSARESMGGCTVQARGGHILGLRARWGCGSVCAAAGARARMCAPAGSE